MVTFVLVQTIKTVKIKNWGLKQKRMHWDLRLINTSKMPVYLAHANPKNVRWVGA